MFDAARDERLRLGADAGPLTTLRVGVAPGLGLLRIGPAWAVLAGALASGAPAALAAEALPLRLAGAALLADAVWGVFWRLTAREPGAPIGPVSAAADSLGRLPYFQAGSPAGRSWRLLRDMAPGATWQELLAAVILALALGLLLGLPALALTVAAWAVTLWGWLLVQADRRPAACDALLNVGLPWLLGLTLAAWPAPAAGDLPLRGLALGFAFTILGWGARRAFLTQGRLAGGVWLGQAAVVIALIALQQTVALVLVAVLLLPPAWLIWRATITPPGACPGYNEGVTNRDVRDALARSGPWWLAAMLAAAAFILR